MNIKNSEKKDMETLRIIAEFVVEEYRFMRTFSSAVKKIYGEDSKRYISAYTYHENKVRELMEKFDLKLGFFDGWEYDEGLPVTPLNVDEFDVSNQLIVEQTIEPTVITSKGNIIRIGTVSLSRKEIYEVNKKLEDNE